MIESLSWGSEENKVELSNSLCGGKQRECSFLFSQGGMEHGFWR